MRNCAEPAGHGAGRALREEGDRLWCHTGLWDSSWLASPAVLWVLLEPLPSHSRESLSCLQPPRIAVLVEWASLGLEIIPCGNAAEEEGM